MQTHMEGQETRRDRSKQDPKPVPSRLWWAGKTLEGMGIVAAYFAILVVLSYPVVTAIA